MKKAVLLVIFISWGLVTSAQTSSTRSKVKLFDGSEFEVLIIENQPGKYIKIQLPGNEQAKISYNNIAYIKHKSFKYHGKLTLKEGFHLEGSFSLLFGRGSEYSDARVGLGMGFSGNYRFNSFISLGIGIEPTALLVNGENLMLPVYIRAKGNFVERRIAAVYWLDAGWAFVGNNQSFDATVEGGWLLRPSIGVRFNKFTLGVGYQIQELTTTIDNSWVGNDFLSVERRIMKNVVISTRLTF